VKKSEKPKQERKEARVIDNRKVLDRILKDYKFRKTEFSPSGTPYQEISDVTFSKIFDRTLVQTFIDGLKGLAPQYEILIDNALKEKADFSFTTDDPSSYIALQEGFFGGLSAPDKTSSQENVSEAVQMLIDSGITFKKLELPDARCIEIDFKQDWTKALDMFGGEN